MKVVFHFHDIVVPYIAAGPTMVFVDDDDVEVHYGLATTWGLNFWLGKHWGLLLEGNYNLLNEHDDALNEVGVMAGAAVRW